MSFAFNCTNYYVGNLEDNILNAKSENPKQYRKYIRNLVKTNSTSETIPVLKHIKTNSTSETIPVLKHIKQTVRLKLFLY